jgi:hypothetical protein
MLISLQLNRKRHMKAIRKVWNKKVTTLLYSSYYDLIFLDIEVVYLEKYYETNSSFFCCIFTAFKNPHAKLISVFFQIQNLVLA